ncbi:MAG: response regulator, partial [Desulfarculus sp.]|nr:response regulator [Desulfarculus sp.]
QGSLFQVYFPLAQGQALEPPPPPGRVPRGRERVLLVDDEPAVASMAGTMLRNLGYQVRAFTDSRQALAAFRQDLQAFDLLLTDQTMASLTGSELAQRILELRPGLPVLLCSGHGPALSPGEARALGIRQILKKPIPRRELAMALRQALAGED